VIEQYKLLPLLRLRAKQQNDLPAQVYKLSFHISFLYRNLVLVWVRIPSMDILPTPKWGVALAIKLLEALLPLVRLIYFAVGRERTVYFGL
jgi:hypothetical protein